MALYANPFGMGADRDKRAARDRRKDAFLDGYGRVRALTDAEIASMNLFTPMRRLFNIGYLYIALSNTWGDEWALRNATEDIETLKRWLDLNPVF